MNIQTKPIRITSRGKRLGLAIALAGAILTAGLVLVRGIHRIDPKRIESTIAQNLHPGADTDSVLHFLVAQRIPHSAYLPEYHRIYARIDRSTVGLIKGHIHIEFNFDTSGKLVSYEVKELFDFF
jgi:hypothetical protein